MDFKKSKPIYMQIADSLCERILADEWASEERIPSVRDIAAELGVNPNTAMRAFDYLQNAEIIYPRRGEGYFLDKQAKKQILNMHRKEFLRDEAPYFLNRMKMLGITWEDLQKDCETRPQG